MSVRSVRVRNVSEAKVVHVLVVFSKGSEEDEVTKEEQVQPGEAVVLEDSGWTIVEVGVGEEGKLAPVDLPEEFTERLEIEANVSNEGLHTKVVHGEVLAAEAKGVKIARLVVRNSGDEGDAILTIVHGTHLDDPNKEKVEITVGLGDTKEIDCSKAPVVELYARAEESGGKLSLPTGFATVSLLELDVGFRDEAFYARVAKVQGTQQRPDHPPTTIQQLHVKNECKEEVVAVVTFATSVADPAGRDDERRVKPGETEVFQVEQGGKPIFDIEVRCGEEGGLVALPPDCPVLMAVARRTDKGFAVGMLRGQAAPANAEIESSGGAAAAGGGGGGGGGGEGQGLREHAPTKVRSLVVKNTGKSEPVKVEATFARGSDDPNPRREQAELAGGAEMTFEKDPGQPDQFLYDVMVASAKGSGFLDLPPAADAEVDVQLNVGVDESGAFKAAVLTRPADGQADQAQPATKIKAVRVQNMSSEAAVVVKVAFAEHSKDEKLQREQKEVGPGETVEFGPHEAPVLDLQAFCGDEGGRVKLPMDDEKDVIELLVRKEGDAPFEFGFAA